MTQIERITATAINAVRLQGCKCDPHVAVSGSDGFYSAIVAHDDWCPLAPKRTGKPAIILPSKAGEAHV
jgi:hypothetical protein